MISGANSGTLRIWDVASGKLKDSYPIHLRPIKSVAVSPDGLFIATGSIDTTAKVLNTSGIVLFTLREHVSSVDSVAFSPDSTKLATASWDGTVRLWEIPSGKALRTYRHPRGVRTVKFSPGGRFIATGSFGDIVRVWSVETGRELRTLTEHQDFVNTVAFSPCQIRSDSGQCEFWSGLLASGSLDTNIKLWDISDLLP